MNLAVVVNEFMRSAIRGKGPVVVTDARPCSPLQGTCRKADRPRRRTRVQPPNCRPKFAGSFLKTDAAKAVAATSVEAERTSARNGSTPEFSGRKKSIYRKQGQDGDVRSENDDSMARQVAASPRQKQAVRKPSCRAGAAPGHVRWKSSAFPATPWGKARCMN